MSLQDGDLVIVYTDGLADNVFPSKTVQTYFKHFAEIFSLADILKICALTMNGPGSDATHVQAIAGHLIHHSRACMFSDRVTPFELEARQHRKRYEGGVSHFRCNIYNSSTIVFSQKVDEFVQLKILAALH